MKQSENLRFGGRFKIEVFEKGQEKPVHVTEFDNLLMNAGGQLLGDLLIGAGGTPYNAANARIGSGDSNTAVSAAHTDLQAASNKLRVAVSSASRTGQIISWVATFSTSQANWQWNEVCVANHATAGTMLCRALVASPFTKTASQTVVVTYSATPS